LILEIATIKSDFVGALQTVEVRQEEHNNDQQDDPQRYLFQKSIHTPPMILDLYALTFSQKPDANRS